METKDEIIELIKRQSNIPSSWNIDNGLSFYFNIGLSFRVIDDSHNLVVLVSLETDDSTYEVRLADEKVNSLGCIRNVAPLELAMSIKILIQVYKQIKKDERPTAVYSENYIVANDPNVANQFYYSHFCRPKTFSDSTIEGLNKLNKWATEFFKRNPYEKN